MSRPCYAPRVLMGLFALVQMAMLVALSGLARASDVDVVLGVQARAFEPCTDAGCLGAPDCSEVVAGGSAFLSGE